MIIENSELYNHVDILVNTKKTPTTLDKLQYSTSYIENRMLKDDEEWVTEEYESVNILPSVVNKMAVSRFNLQYADRSDDTRHILK